MTGCLHLIGTMLRSLWSFSLPVGISFGVLLLSVVSIPLLYKFCRRILP